jgi:hypothetical protein
VDHQFRPRVQLWTSAATESNDNHAHGARAHQSVGNFQSLLTSIGLRNKQIINVHPKHLRIARIKRMFRINESTLPTRF